MDYHDFNDSDIIVVGNIYYGVARSGIYADGDLPVLDWNADRGSRY